MDNVAICEIVYFMEISVFSSSLYTMQILGIVFMLITLHTYRVCSCTCCTPCYGLEDGTRQWLLD